MSKRLKAPAKWCLLNTSHLEAIKTTIKPGISPQDIAQLFYKLIEKGDRDEWLKTFTMWHQERADRYGSSPDLYWRAAMRTQEKYGYKYVYLPKKDQQVSDTHWKIWFQRVNRDGKNSGMPLPIHIRRDEDAGGEWRVDTATV